MQSNERVIELLFETGAFQVLAQPVILTSGKIGIYYINTEKLVQDGGKWEGVYDEERRLRESLESPYDGESRSVINHAISMMDKRPTFEEVIEILSQQIISSVRVDENSVISGGERRDWLFSGPVAMKLRLKHISLYKDGTIWYRVDERGSELIPGAKKIEGLDVIHVADLMTTGSSAYDPRNNPPTGWIPMLRNQGANVNTLFNVVTRLQGGEEALRQAGIETKSLVAIDESFVEQGYSKGLINDFQRDTALAYMGSPDEWGESYIDRIGISPFVAAFDPQGGKLDRARKFLKVYERVLKKSGRLGELDARVKEKYNTGLEGL